MPVASKQLSEEEFRVSATKKYCDFMTECLECLVHEK